MPHDNTQQRPGHHFTKAEPAKDSKGEEFVDPLAQHGNASSSGYRQIRSDKPAPSPDRSDLQASKRRGAVLNNTGEVTESSANRVKRTKG